MLDVILPVVQVLLSAVLIILVLMHSGRDTGFVGPVNIHFEHSDLLGTDVGTWKPAMSKAQILALFRADLEFTRGKMRAAGLV